MSDGSIPLAELRSLFAPIEPQLAEINEYVNYHAGRHRPGLAKFAERHIFGAKLAILIAESDSNPFLWMDSDVLFFGDLSERLRSFGQGRRLRVLRDFRHSYEPHLMRLLGEDWLARQDAVNAGFLLAHGIPYDELEIDTKLLNTQAHWDWLTEQTVIAYCAAHMESEFWRDDEMVISFEDLTEILGNPAAHRWRGRHYIMPCRHIFWRDAIMLSIRGTKQNEV